MRGNSSADLLAADVRTKTKTVYEKRYRAKWVVAQRAGGLKSTLPTAPNARNTQLKYTPVAMRGLFQKLENHQDANLELLEILTLENKSCNTNTAVFSYRMPEGLLRRCDSGTSSKQGHLTD
ncbi:hypothetical protein EVAR_69930_1 [Eumeta japonica]|uniref:Uncharacterized protein n=1 Tax=Eumeta variegata TaxID=151549 RepID=A0A4C2A4G1_EUMVA|nr:hypothetical protein EVAR_69930_1 [Eumeta japonica]